MSSVKEYMHEIWSQVDVEVIFTCPHCHNTISKWLRVAGDEEEQFVEVSCDFDDDEDAWTVIIRNDDSGWSAELEDAPEVDVTINVDDSRYDQWEEPDPEPGAYGIFQNAMGEWRRNVFELSTTDGASSRNRMLFTTLYSIFEAYLSDAIIGSALADVPVQTRLVKVKELDLHDKQLSLDTVLENPNVVRDMLRAVLQKFSFHKLVPVSRIAEVAFGKPILPPHQEDRALAVASVQKRHDCVHRNGFDTQGNQHTDITQEYLNRAGKIFECMAAALEDAIRHAEAKKWLEPLDAGDDLKPDQ
ncbi:hypothetical protein ASF70_13005 [Rhizobium sp. Leaf321]|uniref:hypothetical protein n=1 Tax=Rhizobium sp. Leaf321 TaxID=1736335 RepID=UPI0007159E54|nr:hypothetical protein [Rhizobium sp. Leaf321]KQQ72443.1 hypothetical protein ASF70_13005 [Rhizobium sp. Leaf321]